MEPGQIALAGIPAALARIAQAQFDELYAECVACAQPSGEIDHRMAVARAGHPHIDLAEQDNVGTGSFDQLGRRLEILQPLGIPEHDTCSGDGRRHRCGLGDLDGVQAVNSHERRLETAGLERG